VVACKMTWHNMRAYQTITNTDILSTYYKCTFSAVTHKLHVSGHVLIWTFFLVSVCGTRAQSSSAPFSYILYTGVYFEAPQTDAITDGMHGLPHKPK
jgi:hypothetical protein